MKIDRVGRTVSLNKVALGECVVAQSDGQSVIGIVCRATEVPGAETRFAILGPFPGGSSAELPLRLTNPMNASTFSLSDAQFIPSCEAAHIHSGLPDIAPGMVIAFGTEIWLVVGTRNDCKYLNVANGDLPQHGPDEEDGPVMWISSWHVVCRQSGELVTILRFKLPVPK
jgi:hypothetical protein